MSPFTERERELLLERLDRLRNLVELKAPQPVLESAGGHTIRAIAYALGPGVFTEVGRHLVAEEKERLGLCRFHDEEDRPVSAKKTPHGESWGLCDGCLEQALSDDEAADAAAEADA